MSKWQDLKDELDRLEALTEGLPVHFAPNPLEVVAGRVLALWQPCNECADPVTGDRVDKPCSRCGGTGVAPNDHDDAAVDLWRGQIGVTAPALARYLFGEGDR